MNAQIKAKKTTSGIAQKTPPIVPVTVPIFTASFTAFIGGAADKYPFLYGDAKVPGLGPTGIVKEYREGFSVKNKQIKNSESQYYGYEEAYAGGSLTKKSTRPDNAFLDIQEFMQKHPKGQVNLVGHSLGGWNAAGLAEQLLKAKICQVNLLITIDPVGVILSYVDNPITRAQIYYWAPKPKVKKWISITCDPKNYVADDAIADAGGQWETYPQQNATIFHKTTYSHANFQSMMQETIYKGKSCEKMLIEQLELIK